MTDEQFQRVFERAMLEADETFRNQPWWRARDVARDHQVMALVRLVAKHSAADVSAAHTEYHESSRMRHLVQSAQVAGAAIVFSAFGLGWANDNTWVWGFGALFVVSVLFLIGVASRMGAPS